MPASAALQLYGATTGELLTMARGGPPNHELLPPMAANGHQCWDGRSHQFAPHYQFSPSSSQTQSAAGQGLPWH